LKGVIFIVLLLRGIWMFNKFDIIWILTEGGPGKKTETAAIFAFKTAMIDTQLGRGAAISVVLFALLTITAIIYFVVLKPSEEVRVE
jgi:multiple sugar transport system permease protein